MGLKICAHGRYSYSIISKCRSGSRTRGTRRPPQICFAVTRVPSAPLPLPSCRLVLSLQLEAPPPQLSVGPLMPNKQEAWSLGMRRKTLLATLLLVAVIALVGLAYYESIPRGSGPAPSFELVSGTAVFNPITSNTNVTLVVRNTGTVPFRMDGHARYFPTGYQPISGSIDHTFYSAEGTRIHGSGGQPPDTSSGGRIVISYLVKGADPGRVLAIPLAFEANGIWVSHPTSLTVVRK
jgi:hypothetical protein